MNRNSIIVIVLILLSLGGTFIFNHELSESKSKYQELIKENENLKQNYEKCSKEYAVTLEDYNKILRKDLVKKYLDYLVDIDGKITEGYKYTDTDKKNVKERIAFILENLHLLELDKEKALQYVSFLASMQKRFDN